MKKIFSIIVLMLFIVACGSKAPEKLFKIEENKSVKEVKVEPTASAPTQPASQQPPQPAPTQPTSPTPSTPVTSVTTQPSPTVPAEQSSIQIDSKSREVLQKADLKVKSFSYIYREPPYNQGSDKFMVMGDNIRIMLGENAVNLASGISDVYLNIKTKEAVGYCFRRDSFLCRDREGQKFEVKYKDLYRLTSYQWMKKIVESQRVGSEQMDGRTAIVLSTRLTDQPDSWDEVRFYIDEYFGLPLKIVIETNEGELTYNFDQYDTNTYAEQDVTPPVGY
ncbi:hypothetical protein J4457_00220 [Candidatus Woesearchaeota archaeon]|nr:hypothetical protein [Candidatus Woesearchaeota archaeon]